MTTQNETQPRERAVRCQQCRMFMTTNVDAICDPCKGAHPANCMDAPYPKPMLKIGDKVGVVSSGNLPSDNDFNGYKGKITNIVDGVCIVDNKFFFHAERLETL